MRKKRQNINTDFFHCRGNLLPSFIAAPLPGAVVISVNIIINQCCILHSVEYMSVKFVPGMIMSMTVTEAYNYVHKLGFNNFREIIHS